MSAMAFEEYPDTHSHDGECVYEYLRVCVRTGDAVEQRMVLGCRKCIGSAAYAPGPDESASDHDPKEYPL